MIHLLIEGTNVHHCQLHDTSIRMTICGTNEYMAPELLFDEEYGASVDIFSFGMVLFEIIGRKHAGYDNYCARKPQNRCSLSFLESS